MKKAARHLIYTIPLFLFACTANRMITQAPIGILPLLDYTAVNQGMLKDTSLAVYNNEASFSAAFTATSPSARKPTFGGQLAVAVSLKAPSTLYFERATKGGSKIFIYLKSCESVSQPSCQTGQYFLATVPKVGDAESVEFLINDEMKGRVDL